MRLNLLETLKSKFDPANVGFQGFQILTGYNLAFEDFENKKSIEGLPVEMDAVCISFNGFTPEGQFENRIYQRLGEDISIFLRTDKDAYDITKKMIEYINGNNDVRVTDEAVKYLDFTGATPYKVDTNYIIFVMEYIL